MFIRTLELRIILSFLILVSAAPSALSLTNCQSAIILNGIDFHGSIVCNSKWLDRMGSRAILSAAQACNKTPGMVKLGKRGFLDFDRHVKEDGKKKACLMLDKIIQSFSNSRRNSKATPLNSEKSGSPVATMVFIDGTCDFRVNGQKLDCEGKAIYTKFQNHRVAFDVVPNIMGSAGFSGGKDTQFDKKNYLLTVDRMVLSGGTIVPADGICSMKMSADGRHVYKLQCKALAHDGRRFELKFQPSGKAVRIRHFN